MYFSKRATLFIRAFDRVLCTSRVAADFVVGIDKPKSLTTADGLYGVNLQYSRCFVFCCSSNCFQNGCRQVLEDSNEWHVAFITHTSYIWMSSLLVIAKDQLTSNESYRSRRKVGWLVFETADPLKYNSARMEISTKNLFSFGCSKAID